MPAAGSGVLLQTGGLARARHAEQAGAGVGCSFACSASKPAPASLCKHFGAAGQGLSGSAAKCTSGTLLFLRLAAICRLPGTLWCTKMLSLVRRGQRRTDGPPAHPPPPWPGRPAPSPLPLASTQVWPLCQSFWRHCFPLCMQAGECSTKRCVPKPPVITVARHARRTIASPCAELLPCWRKGLQQLSSEINCCKVMLESSMAPSLTKVGLRAVGARTVAVWSGVPGMAVVWHPPGCLCLLITACAFV